MKIIFRINFTAVFVVIVIIAYTAIIKPFAIIKLMLGFTAVSIAIFTGDPFITGIIIAAKVSFNYYFSINLYK